MVRSESKEHYSKITLTINHNSSHSLCPFNVPGINYFISVGVMDP